MRLSSRMMECSISACSTTTPSLIDVYGPTKVSVRRQPAPMTTGPRTVQRSRRAALADLHGALERACRRARRARRCSMVLRMRRLASSMSSSLPVSFHQPVTDVRLDAQAAVDHVLDGVGDLELAAGARA